MSGPQDESLWPKPFKDPIETHLESIGYYNEYVEVWSEPGCESLKSLYGEWPGGYIKLPKGMKGEELISIRKSLSAEYKAIEGKNDPILEAQKTGAAIGYDWMEKNKKN